MNTGSVYGRMRSEIIDAGTGRVVKASPWQSNMIFDAGLNRLASGIGYTELFQGCKIGSSNAANSVASGAVTFTQSGTAITASGSFFTSGMSGAILKYGTGTAGAEQYITFVDATHATSATSTTVSSPIAGVVWLVQQTTLVAFLYSSTTLNSSAGANGSVFVTNSNTQQRTFVFPQQASPYTINEIGYYDNNNNAGTVYGRVVLGTGDTIAPTQFYQVVVQMTYVITPAVPTAVANNGTGGINNAGIAGLILWDGDNTSTSGGVFNPGGSNTCDGARAQSICLMGPALTLPANPGAPGTGASLVALYFLGTLSISNVGQAVGVGLGVCTFSLTTAGETFNAISIGGFNNANNNALPVFGINLTTGQVLPNGTFSGTFTWQNRFLRTLNN